MTITTSYDQINSFRPDCATGRFPNDDLQPCSPWGAINGLYLDAEMNLVEIIDNEKRCSQHQSPFIHEIPDRVTELLNKADAAQRRAQQATTQLDHEWHLAAARWLANRAAQISQYPTAGKTADLLPDPMSGAPALTPVVPHGPDPLN